MVENQAADLAHETSRAREEGRRFQGVVYFCACPSDGAPRARRRACQMRQHYAARSSFCEAAAPGAARLVVTAVGRISLPGRVGRAHRDPWARSSGPSALAISEYIVGSGRHTSDSTVEADGFLLGTRQSVRSERTYRSAIRSKSHNSCLYRYDALGLSRFVVGNAAKVLSWRASATGSVWRRTGPEAPPI